MKKLFLGGFALVLAVSVAMVFFSGPRPAEITITTDLAVPRSFEVIVRATGELDAVRSTIISSELSGDKSKIVWLVKDGARVGKGDVLVRFDPSEFEDKVHLLEAKVMELEAMVEANNQIFQWEKSQLEREIQTMEIDLRAAELDLIKLEKGEGPLELSRLEEKLDEAAKKNEKFAGYEKELKEYQAKGFIKPSEIEEAGKEISAARRGYEMARQELATYRDYVLPTALEKSKAMVAQARVNLEQNKKNGSFKIGKAQAALILAAKELESNRALLQKAREDLEKTEMSAPIPGMAILREEFHDGERRKPRMGDKVLRNQPIVFLPDITKMVVRTRIREIDLHKVAAGEKALVRIDAYPDLVLGGGVEAIGALAEVDLKSAAREKYFTVDVIIDDEDPRLRPGMTARVEILCAKLDEVLSVPVHAIFMDDGRPYCLVYAGERLEKRFVSVGAANEFWAQITAGLNSGDRISLIADPDR